MPDSYYQILVATQPASRFYGTRSGGWDNNVGGPNEFETVGDAVEAINGLVSRGYAWECIYAIADQDWNIEDILDYRTEEEQS